MHWSDTELLASFLCCMCDTTQPPAGWLPGTHELQTYFLTVEVFGAVWSLDQKECHDCTSGVCSEQLLQTRRFVV